MRASIDAIAQGLPEYRVAFSTVDRMGHLVVDYSRNVAAIPSLEGLSTDISAAPLFLDAMFRLETVVVDHPETSGLEQQLARAEPRLSAAGSRLFCGFDETEGRVTLLTLTKPTVEPWDPALVETVRELGEIVHLLRRDARTREQLHRNEAKFREFSEHVGAVLWMTDATTREVTYINPAFERIWGRSVESLKGKPFGFLDGVHPEDRADVWAKMRDINPTPSILEYRVLRPDGRVVWVKDSYFPVRDESGALCRVVGIVEDITALKQTEAKLETTRAQVIAKAKFAAIGEMASGIAHEINNPLAVIAGLARQMREGEEKKRKPAAETIDHLTTMEKMVNRISAITRGLRTFSRQTDRDPFAPVSVSALVAETASLFAPRAEKDGAFFETSLPAETIEVNGRSSELIQVLLNLLNNALDASAGLPERKVSLVVRRDGASALFLVQDNGPGVPLALWENIFQPFFTTKEVGRGTGLGLSISRRIMEDHGGRLGLDPQHPPTTFVVQLPILEKR